MTSTTTTPIRGTRTATTTRTRREPIELRKRIGSTKFIVRIHPGLATIETLEDKLLRLIMNEVRNSA